MTTSLKPYPAYKDSGVSWLREIPTHWNLSPGRATFREKKVKNTGMIESQVLSLSYGRIVVKPPEKLHGLVPESFETYQVVGPGDVIVRSTDLQNDWNSLRIGLVKDRGIITSAYLCLNVNGTLLPEYAHLILHAYDLKKIYYGLGSGLRQNLDFSDFKYLPILVPPIGEQDAIGRFLDHMDGRINRYIRIKRKLIALLNEQKQAIIHHAVTRGLDPNVALKPSGIDWLGDIPAHWEGVALKRVLRQLIDCEHKTAPGVEESSFRVVRTSAVKSGQLRLEGTYFTSKQAFHEWTRRGMPEVDDVIFTREAPAGEACVIPDGMNLCLGQRTVLMKLDKAKYNAAFLVHMIYGGPPRDRIRHASQGSTVDHFNMEDIATMPVLAPPLNEQLQIVGWIATETCEIDLVVQQATNEIDLIREYRTRLIADVVTGKLDVRGVELPALDEGDEPQASWTEDEMKDEDELDIPEEDES